MKEKEIEAYFVWAIERIGGKSYKFTSPAHKGVSDRIACLPDGRTIFVELKTKGGRLSPLQKIFAEEMKRLNQQYTTLWSKEQIDNYIKTLSE